MMNKSVGIRQIVGGWNQWEAWIYCETYRGTYDECVAWLRNNGEEI